MPPCRSPPTCGRSSRPRGACLAYNPRVDIQSQSALLAAIFNLALAVSMLLRPHRQRVLTLFSFLCLTVSAFYLSEFLFYVAANDFWTRTSILIGSLIPVSALGFFTEFLQVTPYKARRAQLGALVVAFGGLIVAATPLANMSAARAVIVVWIFGSLVLSVSQLLRRRARNESRIERTRLSYLTIGAAAALLAGALDFIPRAGISFPPLGAAITTLYLYFLSQTLLRLRLLDLHEMLGRVATLSVMASILVTIYAVLLLWVGNRPGLFLFNTLLASFAILLLFEPLREKVEEFVVATLFRERFEMIRTLQALKARLPNVIEVPALASLVLDTFHETRRVTHTSIYLLSEERPGFYLLDHRGPAPVQFLDAAAARHLIGAAMRGEKAVLLENLERRIHELRAAEQADHRRTREEVKRLHDLKGTLAQMKAGIVVPLTGGDRVIGFLSLWDERVPEAYASDEIALVLEIAEFVGTVVENSKLYEKMKEKDRLAALGEMAAGLAHEIRNPLGAIKGAAQFLDPKSLPGEDGELLGVIVEEVNRLNSVVTQFLDYSRPLKQSFAPTDLCDVITRTLKLLENEGIPENVTVKLDLPESAPRTQADAEQLKQVLLNLILNAVQAMPEGGTLFISVKPPDQHLATWRIAEAQEFLELRLRDTGKGMSEEARRNIFVPFYTTKEKGTGLGLAISQRIVKNHGGNISVSSRPGEGTEFLIRLPAIPEPKQTELPLLDGTPSPDLTPFPGALMSPVLLDRKSGSKEGGRSSRKHRKKPRTG